MEAILFAILWFVLGFVSAYVAAIYVGAKASRDDPEDWRRSLKKGTEFAQKLFPDKK